MSKLEHYAMPREVRHAELCVIQAAADAMASVEEPDLMPLRTALETLAAHHGSADHLAADLDQALAEFTPVPPATDEPQWVLRTWADVVTGDEVRMPGTDATATIAMRYRHPSEDPSGRSWHMRPGHGGHWNDTVAQPGECVVRLNDEEELRTMLPAAPVEIKLTANEVEAVNAIGWANRIQLTSG